MKTLNNMESLNKILNVLSAKIGVDEYFEDGKLSGYELNTYTDGGVNQIIFLDFRNIDKDPKSAEDFISVFEDRINSIDIDKEIELNRQDRNYKNAFTLRESLEDFDSWKADLVELVSELKELL